MKKLVFIIIFFLCIGFASGQPINAYKYIYIPELTYKDGVDIFGVGSYIKERLKKFGFIVVDFKNMPPEVIEDKCRLLYCYVKTTGGSTADFFSQNSAPTGIVEINIKNCDDIVLFQGHGITQFGSPWQIVFQKSVDKTLKNFTYHYNPNLYHHKVSPMFPAVEKTDETEESITKYLSTSQLDPIEGIYKSYQSENLTYYKIGIIRKDNKFKAIIIETDHPFWKPGEVKSIVEYSSAEGIYSAKWFMGDKTSVETFAILENGRLLSVEVKSSTGEGRQDKFIKLFPPLSGENSIGKDYSSKSGSGFLISKSGLIATNAHVVEGGSKILVTLTNEDGSFKYDAKLALIDKKNDIALLEINDEDFKNLPDLPYTIIEKAEIGEKVFTIGFPLNTVMGTNYKVNDGIISSITGISDDIRYYQISVPLQPGNSGGPLFNKDGNVIGLTTARLNSEAVGTVVENVNYAIKSAYLLNVINMLPNPSKLPEKSQISTLKLEDQLKILRNYVCIIEVY